MFEDGGVLFTLNIFELFGVKIEFDVLDRGDESKSGSLEYIPVRVLGAGFDSKDIPDNEGFAGLCPSCS